MLLDPKSSLVLRDLASDANIFYSKGKLTIIDLESLVLTHPILNDACMLVVESNNEEFLDIYFKSTQFKSIKRNKKKLFMLKAMVIYGAVVDAAINKIDANLESKKLMQRIKNI